MNICMVVGVEDALRVVLDAVKHFAAPDKLPRRDRADNLRRYGDIEVFFDMREGHEGMASFYFVTHDNITVSFSVDFKSLTREAVSEIVRGVEDGIGQYRHQRGAAALFHTAPHAMQ